MKNIRAQLAMARLFAGPTRRRCLSRSSSAVSDCMGMNQWLRSSTSFQSTLGPSRTTRGATKAPPLWRSQSTLPNVWFPDVSLPDYDILDCRNAAEIRTLVPAIGRAIASTGFCVVELADSEMSTLRQLADYFGRRQLHPRADASGIAGGPKTVDLDWQTHRAQYLGVTSGGHLPHTDGTFLNGIGLADRQLVRLGAPKMILLQCVKQSEHGGRNIIVDGARVFGDVMRQEPDLAATLMRPGSLAVCRDDQISLDTPVYQKLSDGRIWLRFRHDRTAYGPAWAVEALRRLHENYHMNPEYQVHIPLQPKQVLIVDNLRCLHGREAFKAVQNQENSSRKFHRAWILNDEQESLGEVAGDLGKLRALQLYRHYHAAADASAAQQVFYGRLGIPAYH